MGKKDTFNVGDFVFAKVKGYRPWPAKIISAVSKKYSVYFYGTEEVGKNIKPVDIWPYKEFKERHSKGGALKVQFEDAIKQIEEAMGGKDSCPKIEKVLEKLNNSVAASKNETLPEEEPEEETEPEPAPAEEPEPPVKPAAKENKKEAKKPAANKKKAPALAKEPEKEQEKPHEEVQAEEAGPEVPVEEAAEEKKPEENDKSPVGRGGRKQKKRVLDGEDAAEVPAKKAAVEKVKAEKKSADSTTNAKIAEKPLPTKEEVPKVPQSVLNEVDPKKKELLIVECQMCATNQEIKMSLSLEKADTKKCLEHLDTMKKIIPSTTQMMMKKNPNCVETMKRLKRYVGNTANWAMSPAELADFQSNALKIRKIAEEIYDAIKQMFDATDERFYSAFTKIVADFEEKTKSLDEDVMAELCFEEELP